jgi:hypothetical protein
LGIVSGILREYTRELVQIKAECATCSGLL